MKNKPEVLLDAYKLDHRRQYPANTQLVFSNFTARGSRVEGINKVIFFGLQYFLKEYLINDWNENFFNKPIEEIVTRFNRRINTYLGPNSIGDQHIRELHALGYLPIEIWALPEGNAVNMRVPMFVIWNTDTRFFWITNMLETMLSTTLWMPCTSATTAVMYRKILNAWALKTNPDMIDFVSWQGHDFSYRGHGSMESAITSGAGHLLAFTGTDTVPAVDFLEDYYNTNAENEMIGGSVAASEHSVASLGSTYVDGVADDFGYFQRMITEIYPSGIVSLVSDTFNFFNVIDPVDGVLVKLKDKIMSRDGKVVIRPDSGDPVKIITGWRYDELVIERDPNGNITRMCEAPSGSVADILMNYEKTGRAEYREVSETERKGLIECLWEIFGGTVSATGFKQLDGHIGAIYGDSITIQRATEICERLEVKGFASTNLVYGIGSFTYQGAITPNAIVTRDTHGFAVKSTYGEVLVDGETVGIEIFKDPITDDGLKKSAKGLIAVYEEGNDFSMKDQATWDEVRNCAFVNVFSNGKIVTEWSLSQIRERVSKNF